MLAPNGPYISTKLPVANYETTEIILVVAVVVSNAKVNVRYWVGPIVTGYPHADKT